MREYYAALALEEAAKPHLGKYESLLNSVAYDMLLRDVNLVIATELAARAHGAVPDNPYIMDTYGWALLKSGETARAIELLALAAQTDPAQAEIQAHLGQAYRIAERHDEARKTLGRSREMSNDPALTALIEREYELLE